MCLSRFRVKMRKEKIWSVVLVCYLRPGDRSYIISALLIYSITSLFNSSITITESLIVAACITPTDPVLASCILKGKFASKYIPAHLRNLLMVESGANDGLGWLFLSFPLLFYKYQNQSKNKKGGINVPAFLLEFLIKCIGYEILLSILVGFIIGFTVKKVYLFCKQRSLIDKESNLAFLLVITTFSIGLNTILKLDDILSLFILGLTFTYENEHIKEIKDMHLLEVIDLLFTLNFFILFGFYIERSIFTGKNIVIGLAIIFLRRLPLVYLFKGLIPQLFSKKEADHTAV